MIGERIAQPVRQVDGGEDAVPGDPADDDPAEHEGGDRHQAAEAGMSTALTGPGHVGAAEDGVAHDARDGVTGSARSVRDAWAGT